MAARGARAARTRALAIAALLGLAGCSGAGVQHHVPVVAATALLNLQTAERCEYVAVGYAHDRDAIAALKNFAGMQGGTLVLGLDAELVGEAERDDETGVYETRVRSAAGKVVRCAPEVQRELLAGARILDTR